MVYVVYEEIWDFGGSDFSVVGVYKSEEDAIKVRDELNAEFVKNIWRGRKDEAFVVGVVLQ